ncbi:nectin-3-like isoform X2 [Chiloscyllium plagiosum]|uniref:nectin-3-like isoform X2 n=1 Tax=Chiloscyllium plagiosum TaxID=36176 RepID=UPI001CB7D37D|nr:nectin-3-like isoform X2 [Chiloscyllium plagiosum]
MPEIKAGQTAPVERENKLTLSVCLIRCELQHLLFTFSDVQTGLVLSPPGSVAWRIHKGRYAQQNSLQNINNQSETWESVFVHFLPLRVWIVYRFLPAKRQCVMAICESCVALVVLLLIVWNPGSEAADPIKLNGGQILRSVGDDALLPCTIKTEQTISQFMWRYKRGQQQWNFFTAVFKNGKDERLNDIFNGRMTYVGQSSKNASMYLRNITLSDEGIYSCIFTLFPDGPVEEDIRLIVRAPPTVTIQTYPDFSLIDCRKHLIVICTAANAKPAASITWKAPFDVHTDESIGPPAENGTVTVSSWFQLCPNKSLHGQKIVCVVEHPTLNASKHVPYLLTIDYANPLPTEFIWTKKNDSIPEGVIIQKDKIKFSKLTSDLEGLYICAASNTAGTASGSFYLFPIADDQQPRHYMVPFIIIILILIIPLGALSYRYHRARKKRPQRNSDKETSPKMRQKTWRKMNRLFNQIDDRP